MRKAPEPPSESGEQKTLKGPHVLLLADIGSQLLHVCGWLDENLAQHGEPTPLSIPTVSWQCPRHVAQTSCSSFTQEFAVFAVSMTMANW